MKVPVVPQWAQAPGDCAVVVTLLQQQCVPFSSDFPIVSVQVRDSELLASEKFGGEDKQQFIQKVEHQRLHVVAFSLKGSAGICQGASHGSTLLWMMQ